MDTPLTRRMRVLRADRHYNQYDLVRLTGISIFRYNKMENGDLLPSKAELMRIAAVYELTYAQAFEEPFDFPPAISADFVETPRDE